MIISREAMREALGIRRFQSPKHDRVYEGVPPWVHVMYSIVYFGACTLHEDSRKNELDRFCIDCLQSFCYNCLSSHALHKVVKIRRYVYCEVINRQDLCKLFNCSGIQAYHTNKTKVIFLKQRTQEQYHQNQQQSTRMDHNCIICNKSLQDASLYCSIECKVSALCNREDTDEILLNSTNSCHKNDENLLKDIHEYEETQRLVSPGRNKQRKGVAFRAPMF